MSSGRSDATITTLLTYGMFGARMVTLHYDQRRKEADFRFGLVRVRENAEFIALYHGERQELKRVQGLFGDEDATAGADRDTLSPPREAPR